MPIHDIIEQLEVETVNVRFSFLLGVCREYFGEPRTKGSHHIFKTPWPGDPRINLQNKRGRAKPYQVKQVIAALKKLADQER